MASFQAVVLGTCLALTGTAQSVALNAEQLYIAVDGNDAWTGRLPSPNHQGTDGPFASFSRAREAVRELRKTRPEVPVIVNVRGGMYRLRETLALTAEDSGSAEAPVTWRAMPGETVRIVGGARLTGFARVTDQAVLERLNPSARDSVVQVDLAACGVRDFGKPTPVGGRQAELVCNSRYMQLARYPNEGEWLRITHIPEGETRIETEYDSHYGRSPG